MRVYIVWGDFLFDDSVYKTIIGVHSTEEGADLHRKVVEDEYRTVWVEEREVLE